MFITLIFSNGEWEQCGRFGTTFTVGKEKVFRDQMIALHSIF